MLVTLVRTTALPQGNPHWILQRGWFLSFVDAYKGRPTRHSPPLGCCATLLAQGSRRLLGFDELAGRSATSCTPAGLRVWEVLRVHIVLNIPR